MKLDYIVYGGLGLVGITATVLLVRHFRKTGTGSSSGPTTWIKPVEGPLTSGVGQRVDPVSKKTIQTHNGQDIAVSVGTPVKAPADGTITSTTASEAGGNQIVMVHNNGWFTGYAHLSQVKVFKGQKVKQGQVIALSGATGAHITGPHLHFTMKDAKGTTLDPKKYVYK